MKTETAKADLLKIHSQGYGVWPFVKTKEKQENTKKLEDLAVEINDLETQVSEARSNVSRLEDSLPFTTIKDFYGNAHVEQFIQLQNGDLLACVGELSATMKLMNHQISQSNSTVPMREPFTVFMKLTRITSFPEVGTKMLSCGNLDTPVLKRVILSILRLVLEILCIDYH